MDQTTANPETPVADEPVADEPRTWVPGETSDDDAAAAPPEAPLIPAEPDDKGKSPRPYVVLEQDPDDETLFRLVKPIEGEFYMVVKSEQAKEQAAEQLDLDKVTLVAVPARSWQPELLAAEVKRSFKRA